MLPFVSRRWFGVRVMGFLAPVALLAAPFDLPPVLKSTEPDSFRFAENDGSLSLWHGNLPVLVYNYGRQQKQGVPESQWRSCYIHPVYGLDGEVLTDDFPPDHLHHRGLFWAWPHVRVDSREYDPWTLRGMRQRFERWTPRELKDGQAVLGVETGWYVEERRVMGELATITVLPENGFGRPIDLQLKWNAEDQPVTIWGAEGKGYGGLSFRFAPGQGTVITTAYGRDRSDLNLARLPWADLTATFRDAPGASGVAIFVSPHHTGFPPTWITRHYGFLGVGWPGADPVILQPGETTTCNYRILIHRGSLDPSRLQQAYHEYARTH